MRTTRTATTDTMKRTNHVEESSVYALRFVVKPDKRTLYMYYALLRDITLDIKVLISAMF